MLRYLLRRLLLAIPTLVIISLATFSLSRFRTTDPVEIEYAKDSTAYKVKARRMGLDQPVFYVTLSSLAFPDTVHRILPLELRDRLTDWTWQNGNWGANIHFWHSAADLMDRDLKGMASSLLADFKALRHVEYLNDIPAALDRLQRSSDTLSDAPLKAVLQAQLRRLRLDAAALTEPNRQWTLWIPALHYYGLKNEYHKWAADMISGNPGVSILTGNPLLTELRPRLLCTLIVNGLAMFFAYLIGIPLGVYMARNEARPAGRWVRTALMLLYALPVIWIGTLLILLLSRQDVGLGLIDGMNGESYLMSNKTFGVWVWDSREKFILPVLTLTLHALAILAMQMRGGVLEVIRSDYIRTARAKGLTERLVYWRHAFRNALFPVITVFAGFFPALFSGSLIVEYLFGFQGMGMKMQSAFSHNDYAVLFAIVMFAAALTVFGNLVADMLYAWADPRVRYKR